jgi:hypothetical protein
MPGSSTYSSSEATACVYSVLGGDLSGVDQQMAFDHFSPGARNEACCAIMRLEFGRLLG